MAATVSDVLDKPESDQRTYRLVELPNGVRGLLVSDPEITAPAMEPPATAVGCLGSCWPRRSDARKDLLVEAAVPGDCQDMEGSNKTAACAV